MAANAGRTNRPYRKASEYLVNSQRSVPVAASGIPVQGKLREENEALRQKVYLLTRKIEHAETEFAQSREYLDNQLDLAHDKHKTLQDQYMKLQSSYGMLQATNRELEEKALKINRLEEEKGSMVKEINTLTNKITDTRNALHKAQEENERLRKDCNIAVQLLKCNQSNYQVQKTEKLPEELQERVSSYKMELQDYNEYINPYAEGGTDSESDEDNFHHHNQSANSNKYSNREQVQDRSSVPVEILAEVLKKPENVHMNLEPSDYIQDPALHSVYKARYMERKLIKPDYDRGVKDGKAVLNERQSNNAGDSASPWEMAPVNKNTTNEESSPWELAPSRTGMQYSNDIDDDGSAGAYGAYSVRPKRRPHYQTKMYPEESNYSIKKETTLPSIQTETKQIAPNHQDSNFRSSVPPNDSYQQNRTHYIRSRSPSPETLEFRQPIPPSKSGVSKYLSRSTKPSPSISSSSTSSSQKTTPLKVRGKEAATNAETSSLLDTPDSDDMPEHSQAYDSEKTSPEKSYLKKETGVESGSLLAVVDDDGVQACGGNELEWDPTLLSNHLADESQELSNLASDVSVIGLQETKLKKEPDLLLSYNIIESPKKDTYLVTLQDLENDNTGISLFQNDSDLLTSLSNLQDFPPPQQGGQLLSEIVTDNPSLENFLLTAPPPPPQEFASSKDAISHPRPTVLQTNTAYSLPPQIMQKHNNQDPEQEITLNTSIYPNTAEVCNIPVRVDEQVEVIDLDEEPRKRGNTLRRRNSLDQAQEFGNVMD